MFFSCNEDSKTNWKVIIEKASKHHNRSYNRSIGCSPLFQAYGEPIKLPADELFMVKKIAPEKSFSNEQITKYSEKYQEYVNRKRIQPSRIPRVGDPDSGWRIWYSKDKEKNKSYQDLTR